MGVMYAGFLLLGKAYNNDLSVNISLAISIFISWNRLFLKSIEISTDSPHEEWYINVFLKNVLLIVNPLLIATMVVFAIQGASESLSVYIYWFVAILNGFYLYVKRDKYTYLSLLYLLVFCGYRIVMNKVIGYNNTLISTILLFEILLVISIDYVIKNNKKGKHIDFRSYLLVLLVFTMFPYIGLYTRPEVTCEGSYQYKQEGLKSCLEGLHSTIEPKGFIYGYDVPKGNKNEVTKSIKESKYASIDNNSTKEVDNGKGLTYVFNYIEVPVKGGTVTQDGVDFYIKGDKLNIEYKGKKVKMSFDEYEEDVSKGIIDFKGDYFILQSLSYDEYQDGDGVYYLNYTMLKDNK